MLLGACLFSANSGHPQQSVTRSIPAQVFREMEDYRPEAHHRSHRAIRDPCAAPKGSLPIRCVCAGWLRSPRCRTLRPR